MADLQQQLQAILSDPEAMGQITALAGALTGAPPETGAPGAGPPQPEEPSPPEDTPPPDLTALLSALGGGSGPDPATLGVLLSLLGEYTAADGEKTALLEALRPFLSPSRREKLDRAEQAARLTRVARAALRLWKEGQLHV